MKENINNGKVNKLNIGISQKINLGGYETQDIQISLEMTDFDNLDEAVKFGKEYCLDIAREHYKKIKFGEADPRIEKIETMTVNNIEEVKALVKDDVKLYKLFNDKRIALG